jgi:hypothetical protein
MPDRQTLSLADALPLEMARVRDHVLPAYLKIGIAGAFAVALMRRALDDAAAAILNGDMVGMLHVYRELKEFHT